MDFESSWCPVCDRQILPKRTVVPVHPAPVPVPPPPPSPVPPSNLKRTKGTLRQKNGGLVQGTGRVKPNGTLKRTDSAKSQPALAAQPAPPVKTRVVIDQGPIPLYCSDDCRMADINAIHRGLPHNFNPDRDPNAPIHRHTYRARSRSETDDSSLSSSLDTPSRPSSPSAPSPPPTAPAHMSPSLAKFAAFYNFELPPPAPVDDSCSSSDETEYNPREYTSGIMMAGKLISSLCPKPAKPQVGPHRQPVEPRKPVPGWTDGSHAWRSAVYSFSAPKTSPDALDDAAVKAYGGFAASSHRSRGSRAPTPTATTRAPSATSLPDTNNDMLSKFSQSFNRRSESRSSMYPSPSPASTPAFPSTAPAAPQRRERSLLKPGAEGRLLVPDVKMKVHSGSSASLSSAWSGAASTTSSRRSVRSPLSACSDDDEESQRCDSASSLPQMQRRPAVETRSWSYDNLKTYPIMQLPPKKEKRKETQLVNGREVEVEVEVEIQEPRKRLFLFPAPSAAAATRVS